MFEIQLFFHNPFPFYFNLSFCFYVVFIITLKILFVYIVVDERCLAMMINTIHACMWDACPTIPVLVIWSVLSADMEGNFSF